MTIKTTLAAAAAAMTFAGAADAALIDIDLGQLLMIGVGNNVGPYTPTGGFTVDSDTGLLSNVFVNSPFDTYTTGNWDPGDQEFALTGYDSSLLYINIFGTSLADLAGLTPGISEYMGADPTEWQPDGSGSFVVVGDGFDPGITVTVQPGGNTTSPVPLPAGLPLMLAGLGVLGLVRRQRQAD